MYFNLIEFKEKNVFGGVRDYIGFLFYFMFVNIIFGKFFVEVYRGGGYGLVEWREEIDDKLRFCM